MANLKITAGAAIAIAATGIFLTLLTTGLLMPDQTMPPEGSNQTMPPEGSNQTMPSGGTIITVNIGVYLDSNCTQNATSIDWGVLTPGGNATKLLYVKNSGTVPVNLTMTTESWQPTNASSLMTLTWNLENAVLNAKKSNKAVLTLAVSPQAADVVDFSFNILITGTEQAT